MDAEDLTEVERAGRRCTVCHSARGWRRFEVVRAAERDPVVLCASCRARFANDPRLGRKPAPAAETATPASKTRRRPKARPDRHRAEQRPDRLQTALRALPQSFSTAMAARVAGLNNDKTLARLQELERRGEVWRVGNRWSTEAPPTDLTAALDRLEARTSNLRIVRERTGVG